LQPRGSQEGAMEKFVDRIVETDQKARQLIDAARREKTDILEKAKQAAEQHLADQAAALANGERKVDEEMAAKQEAKDEELNQDYLRAKHALDAKFDANYDLWLKTITESILSEG
jgi:vacuolar-type H+-ATPase subunit H